MNTVTYYTAPWCAPCKALLPKVEKLANEMSFTLNVVDIDEIDVDDLNVQSVPTVIVNDFLVLHPAGMPFTTFKKMLEEALR